MSKRIVLLLLSALVISMLAACGTASNAVSTVPAQVGSTLVREDAGSVAAVEATREPQVTMAVADSVSEAAAENSGNHEDPEDYTWDSSDLVQIALDGTSVAVSGAGATVDGSTVTIARAGVYSISGSLSDGQIIVNTEDEGTVQLVLNGVDIRSSAGAAISVMDAEEVIIVLADDSENTVSDAESYLFDDPEEDEPNAAIFSRADLTIYGNGSLSVEGNYNDGIASKDGLIIAGGTLRVSAIDDGIRGKDYLIVKGGNIMVESQGDGLKADNAGDATKGYVLIEDGVLDVTAGRDAIQAETDVLITDGEITLSSGGGSSARIDQDTSAKGIRAAVAVQIDGGTFVIDSADDAIHSNGSLVINGGTFILSTGDDAMHADSTIEINGGEIEILNSFEGIESAVITINDGEFHIVSSDDGLNVAGGNDGSGMDQRMMQGGRPGRVGGRGQVGGPGQDAFAASGDYYLYINGGYIEIEATGDGIDANGAIEMTGGIVLVNGPTQQMNSALDYDRGFKITGGFLVAVGSAGMAQAPDTSSTQNSLLLNFNGTGSAGLLLHIQSSDGKEILTFSPTKPFQSIAFSSPELEQGATYEVYYGGSSTGTVEGSLYQGGAYSPGTLYTSFTVSGVVTALGSRLR